MKFIAQKNEKKIWLHELEEPYRLCLPFEKRDYVCILFNNSPDISPEHQHSISEQLVQSGCRYAVCAGVNCSAWDDSIAWAYLETTEGYASVDETMVMTSWHSHESVDDIIVFGLQNTNFDTYAFDTYLVLLIRTNPQLKALVIQAVQKLWDTLPVVENNKEG